MEDFRTIEPGKYVAKAIKAEHKTTKNGFRMVEVTFRLEDSEDTIAWAGWLGDDAAKNARTLESLRHCGWTGNDVHDLSGITSNRVQLVIADEERNGAWRTRCKWVNKLFASRETAQRRLAIKVPAQSPRPNPFEDDDISF